MTTKVGTPVWLDYGSNDIAACRTFYSELFGWQFEGLGPDFNDYHLVRSDGALVGGLMDVHERRCPAGGPVPSEWGVFLAVDDLEARCAKVEAAGGEVVMAATTVGTAGRFAVAVDPTGAVVSLWEAKEIESFDFTGTAGTPVWFELVTKDYAAATAFYREVFDFDIQPMVEDDTMRYATNGAGEAATSGICDAPWLGEGESSYWRIYLGVDGADSAAEQVTALGGQVEEGPEDSPFGRIVTVRDREGATFQLCSMSEARAQ